MVTLKHVARYAGVSIATVSRVLNDYPHVDDEVRERVQGACEALGYRPNSLARSMRRGFSRSLGLVVRDMASANFGAICAAAEAAAAALGYQLFVCNSSRDPDRERRYIQSLLERQVDGLVLFVADDRVSNLDLLGAGGPPVVLVESELPWESADRVTSNGEAAAAEAARYLIGLGHRRIAFLASGQAITVGRGRLAGYQQALAEAGIATDVALVRHCGADPTAAEPETAFVLQVQPRPTALIISTADLIPGALHAVRASGVCVPGELSVLAFDDREATQFFSPAITVMARNVPDLGTQAVRLLLDRLTDPSHSRSVANVPFSLVPRGSTGPVL